MSSDAFIPLSVPNIAGNEWKYLKECVDTGWVSTAGSFVDRFEREFAAYTGASHAVACQSGTAALHVALQVAGVRAGDEVIVPTLTFIGPANAVTYLGATPILVDVEPDHWLMDLHLVERFLRSECVQKNGQTFNKRTGARIAAAVPVHIVGHPVEMDRLMAMSEEFGFAVIEDATESLGSEYRGRATGVIGHIGCFSFNGNKIMTTGGGGMIVTANQQWAYRAKHLAHQAKVDPVEYVHDEVGYNYRLTNVQAALGVAQLERMAEFVAAKRKIARLYQDGLASLPGITPMRPPDHSLSNWWLFTVLVDPSGGGLSSRDLMHKLTASGIQSRPLWRPLHMGPPHAGRQLLGEGRVARRVYEHALSLPCSTNLLPEMQDRVIAALADATRQ